MYWPKQIMLAIAVVLVCAGTPLAQQKGSVELKTTMEIETSEKGTQGQKTVKRIPIDSASKGPGDIIVFTTVYSNVGHEPATDVMITNPIAPQMTYVKGSADGKDTAIEYSTDGGKTFGHPDALIQKNARGVERRARADEYTHIRWKLKRALAAGDSGFVVFKAKIR